MLTITRTMRKCLNWGIEVVTEKKQRYECTLYFSLRESKAAGFHVVITDSRLHWEIPYWWRVITPNWIVLLPVICRVTWELCFSQSKADLGNDASHQYGICARLTSDAISIGNQWWRRKCRLFSQALKTAIAGLWAPLITLFFLATVDIRQYLITRDFTRL